MMSTSDSTCQVSLVEAWNELQAVLSYVEQQARAFANEPLPTTSSFSEEDLQPHIEDELKVGVIRDRQLVAVYWNELTEDERRAAYVAVFNPCGL